MHSRPISRVLLSLGMLLVLAACGSSPKNITLAEQTEASSAAADKGGATVDVGDIATQPIRYARNKPGCSGTCPRVEVDSIALPQAPKLTQLIDRVLAYMTGINPDQVGDYQTLAQYEAYFWQTAQTRDVTRFVAKIKDAHNGLITVELATNQYLTGAAHGIPATQYLNWERDRQRVLALSEAVIPAQQAAFVAAAKRAHVRWKQQNEDYQRDPATFDRMWPFQETDNFALTTAGLVLKYDAYAIAPYASGQPELLIPYAELSGVLDPKWLPK